MRKVIAITSGSFGPETWPEDYLRYAETVAEVQQLTGTAFPLPDTFTGEGPGPSATRC